MLGELVKVIGRDGTILAMGKLIGMGRDGRWSVRTANFEIHTLSGTCIPA